MRRRRGIWIVGLLAAAAGAAALGAHASSAASTRGAAGAATTDATYSCRVQRQRFVDIYASVTQPPVDGRAQLAVLVLTTGVKTIVKNNTTETVSQVGVRAAKNGLKIDKSSCSRVTKHIPLKPKGLAGPPTTVTPNFRGYDGERCNTKARVLVRLRLKTTNGVPTQALLAVRNDDTRRRPLAFYNWNPRKISLYTGNSCSSP